MKRIYLLRHGKTEHPTGDKEDHERALLEAGRKDSHQIGLKLKNFGVLPEKVITSSAKRAKETVGLCMEAWDDIHTDFIYNGFEVSNKLYSGSAQDYLEVIRSLPEKIGSVMVVGHNPTIEEFKEALSGNYTAVKPAQLLWFEVDVPKWADIAFGITPVRSGSIIP
ncbi:MAG: SixA phosphatase family protein [Spirochaetaceae bacterium]